MADWRTVARAGEVPPGVARVVEIDRKRIALCNVDGELYAIDDVCSHDFGPLGDGVLVDDQIECPRHGALFDVRTGEAVTLPAVRGVATFPVRVEGDNVQVDIG